MSDCKVCGCSVFYLEDGFYFCTECQTQNEEKREEIVDYHAEGVLLKKRKIPRDKSAKLNQESRWTTWEQYNFILLALTDKLIELGATPSIKLTTLQLWAFYLGKLEVAFTSTKQINIPKLARRYHKKDAEIIYGKIKAKRRRKRRASSSSMVSSYTSGQSSSRDFHKYRRSMVNAEYDRFLASQDSGTSDFLSLASQSLTSVRSSESSVPLQKLEFSRHAKAEVRKIKKLSKSLPTSVRSKFVQSHVTSCYKGGPYVITPIKLWAILYLALRIHNQDIHIADMLRSRPKADSCVIRKFIIQQNVLMEISDAQDYMYAREGHLPYYKLGHLLPEEMEKTNSDMKMLSQSNEITHRGFRHTSTALAKFLFVYEISCPDFSLLINRYCKELQLPKDISTYAQRLVAISPPKMVFNVKSSTIPNYEGRAMAFLIVVLKLIFGMDGVTEYEISRLAELLNNKSKHEHDQSIKLFSFVEWQRYIECRKTVLMNKHFPTKFKYDSDAMGGTDLYVAFVNSLMSRRCNDVALTKEKNAISPELRDLMEKFADILDTNDEKAEKIESFPPSVTPMYSYLEQLLDHPMYELPSVLRNDFCQTNVSYLTNQKKFVRYASELGLEVDVVKARLNFLNKIMPRYDHTRSTTIAEWKSPVTVKGHSNTNPNLTAFDYTDMNGVTIDAAKLRLYEGIENSLHATNRSANSNQQQSLSSTSYHHEENISSTNMDYGFENITADGKLITGEVSVPSKRLEFNFKSNYDAYFTQVITTKRKQKKNIFRDSMGRFVRSTSPNVREEPVGYKCPRKIYPWSKVNLNDSKNINDSQNTNEPISCTSTAAQKDKKATSNDSTQYFETLFVPSNDYWMYHYVFSHVKSKHFESFEASLPSSFQWLLNECAQTVEMTTEDLYEEVCRIETYYAYILKPESMKSKCYDQKDNQRKIQECHRNW